MAGTQQPVNPNRETVTTMKTQWQIHYARFFHFPSLPSKCPSLKPLYSRCKKDNPFGVWLSGSSMASVQLVYDQNAHGMILTVTLKGENYEEHYISRLHFSWPQVSCLEECPIRGSRVVFASYRDSLGQVQKFALRFLQSSDSQTFIGSLKESLKDIRNVGHAISKFGSDITPSSEFVSLNGIHRRATEEYTNASLLQNNGLPMQSVSRYASRQHTCPGATILPHDSEAICVSLPSSFSVLLSDSCTELKQVLTGPLTCSLNSKTTVCSQLYYLVLLMADVLANCFIMFVPLGIRHLQDSLHRTMKSCDTHALEQPHFLTTQNLRMQLCLLSFLLSSQTLAQRLNKDPQQYPFFVTSTPKLWVA